MAISADMPAISLIHLIMVLSGIVIMGCIIYFCVGKE
jgi:hypothetical protein